MVYGTEQRPQTSLSSLGGTMQFTQPEFWDRRNWTVGIPLPPHSSSDTSQNNVFCDVDPFGHTLGIWEASANVLEGKSYIYGYIQRSAAFLDDERWRKHCHLRSQRKPSSGALVAQDRLNKSWSSRGEFGAQGFNNFRPSLQQVCHRTRHWWWAVKMGWWCIKIIVKTRWSTVSWNR